ncbi:MAG: SGNH/GDSL hydrolase family protein [Myxococcaceae bacterium]|nr:SGNH/GDSL hydrolase family protein [Myxococcaceae bacterium]MCI0670399.1 SGNH/GDSL hydrolase family protein [Myxococcaceae bacterium]
MSVTSVARVAAFLVALVLGGLHGPARAAAPESPGAGERTVLEKLSRRRIFIGHPAAGESVLDGVRQVLATRAGVLLKAVEPKDSAAPLTPGTWVHAQVGEDGGPSSRLHHFVRWMDEGMAAQVDVAFFELSHADFDARTETRALFETYRSTMDALRARHPGTTFVHVTVPLTRVERGVKGWFKHLVGRSSKGEAENMRREAFNALLRETYGGTEPLFDLARLQATLPDGGQETFVRDGLSWPALAHMWASGDTHLNAAGQAHIAEHLLSLLAALPEPAEVTPQVLASPTP